MRHKYLLQRQRGKTMKKFLLYVLIAALLPASLYAANTFGAGVILGSPSGLTAKLFLNQHDAVDFGIGEAADSLYIYADYLRHYSQAIPVKEMKLYLGIGAGFHDFEKDTRREDTDENRIDIRVPIGIEYMFDQPPIGIFLELVPALRIVPDVDFDIRGGLGARYFF